MFKRVERKRKRRDEDEELGLDQDTKDAMGLNDTDSDESDSGSEEHEHTQSDSNSDAGIGNNEVREAEATSEDEVLDDEPPISIAETLKDPIYLISLDPTIYGCVLCKEKLIKNAGMAAAHRNANAHKRRFEHFKLLSTSADPRSDAWELAKATRSTFAMQRVESREPSKRALKRQAKQAVIHEKRKRHKELKAKAIAKKALKTPSMIEKTNPIVSPKKKSQSPVASENRLANTRKKQRSEGQSFTSVIAESRDARARPDPRAKASSNSTKSVLDRRLKSKRKTSKTS